MKYEDSFLIINIHRMINKIDRKTALICLRYNLTLPQFGALEALFHKGDLSVGDLKRLVLSTDGTVTVVVKNLEKLGLVKRLKDKKDARRSIVSLTDEGLELIKKVYPENEKMIEEEFSIWNMEEKKDLVRLIKKYKVR